jgi:hypothetical protein
MSEILETPDQQVAVIEENALKICQVAEQGYAASGEKGTVVLLRQLENNSPQLADWQFKYRPISSIDTMLTDWKQTKLQDMIIRYNPDVSVICTFLYPNGTHASYHFSKVNETDG